MNSNNFFSFSRFCLLMRNDILLNHKKYLYTIVGAFILGFIVLYLLMPRVFQAEKQFAFNGMRYFQVFIMCLLGLGAFVGSAFSELSNKVKTSNYLLIPASTFEMFLGQFTIRVLAGTAIFLVVFWVDAHLARFAVLSQMVNESNQLVGPEKFKFISEFHYSMFLVKNQHSPVATYFSLAEGVAILLGIFSIVTYLFSVKLFFNKLGLVKAIVSLFALILIFSGVMVLLSHIFYPETKGLDNRLVEYSFKNGYSNIQIWIFSIAYFSSLFLLPIGYFKLKEKQV